MSRAARPAALALLLAACAPAAPFDPPPPPPPDEAADLGRRLLAERKPELALRAYQRALATSGTTRERALAMTGAGVSLVRLGRLGEAIPILEAALELDPKMAPVAFNALGVAYLEAGRPAEAAAALRRADELLGGADPTVAANLAMAETALAERAAADPALDGFDYDVIQYGHGLWRLVPRPAAAPLEESRR